MKLALFLTRGISLKHWLDSGLLDREKLIYEEHIKQKTLSEVFWFTYGAADDQVAIRLKKEGCLGEKIRVVAMPKWFRGKIGIVLYSFFLPIIQNNLLRQMDILKTNQMDGSWSAVIAKYLCKKPLIVRTGYTLSVFLKKMGKAKLKCKICEWIELLAYQHADIAIAASHKDKKYICSKYNILDEKVKVLYNCINTKSFCPINCEKHPDRIIFVGRLYYQKNLFNLIKAVSDCNLTLDIYGEGELHTKLEAWAKKLDAKVNFRGGVANQDLPRIYNHYKYFVLPSFYEGMPKSLLEAMACGLVCIGTDVDGINEVIEDGFNGYLAEGIEPGALIKAINRATHLPHESVTAEAIRKIRNLFSLEVIVKQEKELLKSKL